VSARGKSPRLTTRRLGVAAVALVLVVTGASALEPDTEADLPEGVLWRADMEEGTLADWYYPEAGRTGDYGGGEYNSGSGDTTASTEQARSGSWSARATLADGSGGTRLFRWRESRVHRVASYSAWFHFPVAEWVSGYWNIMQFKSRSAGGANDPIWFLDVQTRSDGSLRPTVVWWPRRLEGPRRGQSGFRRFKPRTEVRIPVGRWTNITARLRQSKDFDGVVQFWIDGQLIFDLREVRTSFPNCRYNRWCASNEWSVNNYARSLSPPNPTIYIDDAEIRR
jgi:Polysaccharide lyase